jgi:hypothetical protein
MPPRQLRLGEGLPGAGVAGLPAGGVGGACVVIDFSALSFSHWFQDSCQ